MTSSEQDVGASQTIHLAAGGNNRQKVLIVYVHFHHYRVPVFEALALRYDLTVIHAGPAQDVAKYKFRQIIIAPQRIWRFIYQPGLVREVRRGRYDAVVYLFDIAWVSTVLAFLLAPARTRRVSWGFWLTGSALANSARRVFARLADANLFYATGAARDFIARGIPQKKVWIARNTVQVEVTDAPGTGDRSTILFLGSFDARKGNDITVAAFDRACARIPENIRLVLVGDGAAKAAVVAQAKALANGHRIDFKPGTFDAFAIREHYRKAMASVSFGQAGLSVLQSLGHGVPFITARTAVSGGEIENIVDGVTGMLCEPSEAALVEAFVRLCTDPAQAARMQAAARDYYLRCATTQHMINGFVGAIEGVELNGDERIKLMHGQEAIR